MVLSFLEQLAVELMLLRIDVLLVGLGGHKLLGAHLAIDLCLALRFGGELSLELCMKKDLRSR